VSTAKLIKWNKRIYNLKAYLKICSQEGKKKKGMKMNEESLGVWAASREFMFAL
jgi:hypothetical protein